MKVTVCFGPVKIIVPCGDGALTVQDLIEKSIQRYRKALGKDDLYWVKVHSLQSQSDGGILDGDDLVSDVADDREKLTALFEEEEAGSVREQLISDGTSSVGTTSPINVNEMNHINNSNNKTFINGNYPQENGELDIVVTGNEAVSKLQVRQHSSPHRNNFTQPRLTTSKTRLDSNANSLPHTNANRYDSDENQDAFDRFSRDSSRRSLSSAHPSVFKWAEAQQRIEDMANQNSPTSPPPNPLAVSPMAREQIEIEMVNDGTPLGIHIIARVENEDGSGYGLVVHGIENGGRAARDQRLQPMDHILAINGKNITQETFDNAQEMMRTAMRAPSVKLLIERNKQSQPLSPSKVPPVVPQRSPQTTLTHPDKNKKPVVGTSTKRISRKLYIQLMKGPQSLGFSITTRDNPIDGKVPIYIKNILPNGAAIADGRLKPGDRLIEVNGIEMSGKTQEEAVSILRSVRRGGVVNLVVSRQEQMEAEPVFPRALPADLSPDDHSSPNNKTIMDFNIALNDTGSAGLGVSVKGKTTGGANGETKDLGIFIKSVMHGGAASKDGRLRPNDQLLSINDVSLINMSNSEAMDTLRKAMSSEKSPRSTIRLVIARRQDVVETLHNALSKGEVGVEASVDRPIDVSREAPKPPKVKQPEKDQEAEDILKQPLMSDQSSLLQNISETLSAKHNVELSPKLDPQSLDHSEGRARVTYPGSTANIHPAGGMTLPSSGEDKALIENGGLHLQVDVNSPNSTTSLSPQSPRAPSPPEWLANWEHDQDGDGELSPVLTRDQFQRDSYARLSFSERKQGGSLDAKQMAWYKKTKGASNKQLESLPPKRKDVAASTGSLTRAASVDSLLDKQPVTSKTDQTEAMKKSNSMDRLNERDRRSSTEQRPSRRRLSRKNGLNESFRAAVDKSIPQQKEASTEGDKSDVPPPMTRDRKRSTKEKKKKEKETTTGTNSKGIKGFFRFGKSRKSMSDDKDSDIVNDEGAKLSKQEAEKAKAREEAEDEQERIQEALRRQREESQEARTKAERMLELRQKYQNHHNHRPEDVSDEEEDERNWQNDDRIPLREQGQEDKDWRYERLSDGRSHPEREYRDSKGRVIDDYHRGRDDNYRTDERDRRYRDDRYRPVSMDEWERRYNEDKYRPERRHSESYEHDHDPEARTGYGRDDRSEKRSKKDGRRESPTQETEKNGKSSVLRRDSSGKGSKKDKKKQKEGKERSDSERDDSKPKKTEQLYDTPQSPAKYAPSEGTRTSRTREQGREEQRRYSQDRPDDKGYGRRNRSHERPRDRGDHHMYHRDRRSDDWQRDRRPDDWPRDRRGDDKRESRPYGGTERGPRRYPQDHRDFGSLDRHSQREFRTDHQRRSRDEYYHQDGHSSRDYTPSHRYPTSGDPRHHHNGDPRYPQGYGQGYPGSSRSVHQRSKSYDMDSVNSRPYDDREGYGDVQLAPRVGYSRGYDGHEGGYRHQEDTARV